MLEHRTLLQGDVAEATIATSGTETNTTAGAPADGLLAGSVSGERDKVGTGRGKEREERVGQRRSTEKGFISSLFALTVFVTLYFS